MNTKISSNVIILNIFKTNDVGKTQLSPENKIPDLSRDQILFKDRSNLASSISVNIQLAYPGHAQNESITLIQQNDVKISNFYMCAISWKLPTEAGIFHWHILEIRVHKHYALDLPVPING